MSTNGCQQVIPSISAPPAGMPLRLRGAMVAVACWAVLILAWSLTPRHAGHGTHEQLGIPGCSFLATTGLPCPSCGMTTSVSAMAHGRIAAAWSAQPFGLALFVALMAVALAGTAEAITARRLLSRLRPRLWWLGVALAGMMAGWGWKLAAGLIGGQLPIR